MIKFHSTYLKVSFIIFFFLCSFTSLGQISHSINYTPKDGLNSSQVYDITQDEKGHLWFATDRGISKFNGYEFKSFTTLDGLTDNTVFYFFHQKDGTIWCTGLDNELFFFDTNNSFKPYPFNHIIQKFRETKLTYIISEILFNDEKLYISFTGLRGYIIINQEGILTDYTNVAKEEGIKIVNECIDSINFTYILNLSQSKKPIFKKSIYSEMIPSSTVSLFETATINQTTLFINNAVYLVKNNKTTIINDTKNPINVGVYDKSHFWVGYRHGGGAIYDLTGKKIRHFLEGKSVTKLFLDHEKGLWISTLGSGVFYFKDPTIIVYLFDKIKSNLVHSLTSNRDTIYIGYYNGYVTKWNGKKHSIVYSPSGIPSPAIVQYYEHLKDVVFTYNQGLSLDNEMHPLKRLPLSLSDNLDQEIIIGQFFGFSTIKEQVSHIPLNFRINDISKNPLGYYLATNQGLMDYRNGVLKEYETPLFKHRMEDIDQNKGTYYAASLGAGLVVFDKDTIYNIDENDGLYSNLTSEVVVENDSTLWVCGIKGLNRILLKDRFNYSISGVSTFDGLINNEITDVEIKSDTIWVGTKEGLCAISKDFFEKKEKSQSNFYLSIKNIKVNDKETTIKELKHLDYTQNRIEILFQGISFKQNKNLHYRYKLEGLEQNWNITKTTNAVYTSIIPGNYTLILQVKGMYGDWNANELRFPIRIYPPYYKAWWFIVLITLFVILLLYGFFKYRILSYNKDIIREMLRYALKQLKPNKNYLVFKEKGREIKMDTSNIYYVKAAGNYLELYTIKGKFTIREKISNFIKQVPDALEFLQVHRSYIIRIDRISEKNKQHIVVNNTEIPVGNSYKDALNNILF
ncbi:hypothetical protein A9Q86_12840 [Flavobacteriales bacterium 33_180_T64]|nr:hypothetical protein A9Q86_12840 [Flavobacteriales bacterium 33_180_T64]